MMLVRQMTFRAKPLLTKEMLHKGCCHTSSELSRCLRGCAANDEIAQAERPFRFVLNCNSETYWARSRGEDVSTWKRKCGPWILLAVISSGERGGATRRDSLSLDQKENVGVPRSREHFAQRSHSCGGLGKTQIHRLGKLAPLGNLIPVLGLVVFCSRIC
jgi:hypothetical protein